MTENRPTLEDQLRVRQMSREELIELLAPTKGWAGLDLSLYIHCVLLWRIIHWNWFEVSPDKTRKV